MSFEMLGPLAQSAETKIVMLVMDGLGGLPRWPNGRTELEAARTPNLDELVAGGICGLHEPVGAGITPGSGPSHLALFGYDPVRYTVGRGALSAAGVGIDLRPGDVAARGNFCTVDREGQVVDRRAGRISSEENARLCALLERINLDGASVVVQTEKEHRFVLLLRGVGLSAAVSDTDPQQVQKLPLEPRPLAPEAEHTSALVRRFIDQARVVLADEAPANMILLRGFSHRPEWPSLRQVFGIKAAAIAGYPMYRGLARLIGMTALDAPADFRGEIEVLQRVWPEFDFFYVHVKQTDSAGEDGDFDRKVAQIEAVDAAIPLITRLQPEVIVVTGDHSTPAMLRGHSWHPVPVLIWSPLCRPDEVTWFGERPCMHGALGPRMRAVDIMPIALANAGRLAKLGA